MEKKTLKKDYTITQIGLSMGGGIVVSFVDDYPDVVDRYLLMTPACANFQLPFGSILLKYKILGDWLFSVNSMLSIWDEKTSARTEFYYPETPDNQKTIEWILQQKSTFDQKKWGASFLNSFRNFPLNGLSKVVERNGSLEKRMMVIWAMYDTTVPPIESFPYFWDCYTDKRNQFIVLADTRHGFHMERIDDSNKLMVNFIKQRSDPNIQSNHEVNTVKYASPHTSSSKDYKTFEFWEKFEKLVCKDTTGRTFMIV